MDDNVIYLGSFSKILVPGFIVGYVLAPPPIKEKLVLAQESAILCPSAFSQMLISEYLATADWQAKWMPSGVFIKSAKMRHFGP